MVIRKKTQTQYLTLLKNIIYENNDSISAESHSVVDDIFLQPGSTILSQIHYVLYYQTLLTALDVAGIENDEDLLTNLQSFFSVSSRAALLDRIAADFDRIAETVSLTRIEGQYAQGYCRFYSNAYNTLTVPQGTQILSRTSPVLTFITEHDITNVPPKYDETVGLYYVSSPIKCTEIGTKGNLQPHRVDKLSTPISNIVAVDNVLSVIGGLNEETNTSLVNRIKIKKAGRNVPTLLGYKNLILGSGFILDAYIATLQSGLVTRPDSNAVDAFVVTTQRIASARQIITEPIAYYLNQSRYVEGQQDVFPPATTSGTIQLNLTKQPVIRIVSVSIASVVQSPSSYSLIKDTGVRSRSTRAFDKLQITVSGSDTIQIDYEYDASIRDVQNLVDKDENKVINSDVLVRLGEEIQLDLDIAIEVYADYSASTVQANIESDLQKFFTGGTSTYGEIFPTKLLNERIDKSDLLKVILNNNGVDRVYNSEFTLSYAGIPIVNYFEPTVIQYARLGTVTWN